ncbi:MAG: polysulfide reductase [Firmicutes bacterium HGW-Firmicutes-14]|nr:MAG: polysulfide reductase [Firmicutes bacterium HGW-Firmicutes-14]
MGFVYPNEVEINWGLFIVLYPYLTGLVAGAFIVSSLYHVFGVSKLKPVSRLALISALALLLVAPLALISHLGQPLRALNLMWTPNPTSAMAGFGYIYSFYLIIVLLEIWFMYRKDLVEFAATREGWTGKLYNILTLGAKDISPAALHTDHKVVSALAIIGIPSAAFLHGYVGFIFGAIKANSWWSTPLMPVIFLLSAIVSGVALLIVVYAVTCWLRKVKIDFDCLMTMNKYLLIFLILAFVLEILEVIHMAYEAEEEWPAVKGLITQVIPFSYFVVQLGQMVMAMFLLFMATFKRIPAKIRQIMTIVSGASILTSVLAMRFNVVVGGQLISKSSSGYTRFHWPLWHEGVIPTIGFLILPFVILFVLVRVLPPWMDGGAAVSVTKRRGAFVPKPVPVRGKLSPAEPTGGELWERFVVAVGRNLSRLGLRGVWREE